MSIITTLLDKKPSLDFIKHHKIGFAFAAALLVISTTSLCLKGLNYGIDFMGGILIEIKSDKKIDVEAMRKNLESTDIKGISIQSFGKDGTGAAIRALEEGKDEKSQIKTVAKIKSSLGASYEYQRVEMVGPQVGGELRKDSILASLLAVLAIAIYVWFRFEWQFAIGSFLSLAYNTVVTLGLYSLIGKEFDLTIVAALLTLIGYSINDTVVCYDRVRDNVRKHKRLEVSEILNLSLNETLGRTFLTGISTLLALLAILILGGDVLKGFAMALLGGIIVGTFSSVFIAVPFLNYFNIKKINEE